VSNSTVSLKIQQSVNAQVPGADPAPIILASTFAMLASNFPFVRTNIFTDQREMKSVIVTEIDVGHYAKWIVTNWNVLLKFPPGSGTYPAILYVADERAGTSTQMPAVRLTNGVSLPVNGGLGWTVATPNPLYVLGNYNCTNAAYLGTTNTSAAVPAALMSDALSILSSAWDDSKSSANFTLRKASDTTVNAAILTGNVPSTGPNFTQFSGGVLNLARLLEDWNSPSTHTLTLNTSLVNLFSSKVATNRFSNPGIYYDPPTRQFHGDSNFLNPAKLPPGTPMVWSAY